MRGYGEALYPPGAGEGLWRYGEECVDTESWKAGCWYPGGMFVLCECPECVDALDGKRGTDGSTGECTGRLGYPWPGRCGSFAE